jgi:Zn finger protein HypA/HybF involved in hydrogenase expression
MEFNFRCKKCNWGCFIDPEFIKKDYLYQCTKCSSVYPVVEEDLGFK